MARRRITPEAQARADRIAAALAGLLEDEPDPPEAPDGQGDPYRAIPKAPTTRAKQRTPQCPACGGELELHYSKGVDIHRCRRCLGLWLGPEDLDQMIIAPEDDESVTAADVQRKMGGVRPPAGEVVYRRCPACRTTMRRRNFADCSGVIVDECTRHGMFLDPGEYEAIEAFIGAGGLVVQRRRLAERRERAERERRNRAADSPPVLIHSMYEVKRWWEIFF